MNYSITLHKKAINFLEKVNEPFYSKIKIAIYNLSIEPKPFGVKKLKLRDAFRIRVGDYRIIYEIDSELKNVSILNIGHRKIFIHKLIQ